jgi:hypothetical protein
VPTTIDDARSLIQSRLAELDAEAQDLERALVSLGEGRGGRTRPRRKATTATPVSAKPRVSRKRKSAKRAPRGARREQLLAAVKANPGARPAELARAIGVKPAQVHNLIAKARKEKLLVKRGMGYALQG